MARPERRYGPAGGLTLGRIPAPLRDAMDQDVEALGLLDHRLEAARPLRARDLDAVLGAVREALLRVRQRVEVAGRQADRFEECARRLHGRLSRPAGRGRRSSTR
jgi:hypothetical protein